MNVRGVKVIQHVHISHVNHISKTFDAEGLCESFSLIQLLVLAVSNVLTALIFSNSRNFETERDTPEKHAIKSLDL